GNIRVDTKLGRVLLNKEIDFGGFGKGFALDRVSSLLEGHGVSHYCINAGGDIFARRGDGESPWEILLEHPDDPSRAIGKVPIDNCSIAASAPNRRKWGEFHHLLNAKTGKPAKGVKAVFAIAKTGIEADAYATALFTAGFEEGIALSSRLPVEALIISSQDKMFQSKGFKAELFG
ncbi:MAG: FAD:protein FMN transferase, partial [Candidatus Micrarchaeia archaeon]